MFVSVRVVPAPDDATPSGVSAVCRMRAGSASSARRRSRARHGQRSAQPSSRRRTRWSAATAERAWIHPRSPGSSNRSDCSPIGPDGVEEHEPDRLLRRASARPGDSRHRHRHIDAEPLAGAGRHRRRDLRRDGAVLGEQLRRDAEQLLLDAVVVGDDGAPEDVARARDGRQACRRRARPCTTPRCRA